MGFTMRYSSSQLRKHISLMLLIGICFLPLPSISFQQEEIKINEKVTGVTLAPLESLVFYPSRNAPAKVESLNHSNIPAQVDAVINHLVVKVGDKIEVGGKLAELDCRDVNLNVTSQTAQQLQAKNKFNYEERQFARGKELAKQKSIGEAELDSLETNLAVAHSILIAQKALMDTAILEQERCIVRAPFTGIVTSRFANEGEMLRKGEAVVEMLQNDNLEVSAEIALVDSDSYEAASSFYFETNGSQYALEARILLPAVTSDTRSRQGRLNFINQTAIPGITGRLYWKSPKAHIPAHLLQIRDGINGVFVADGSDHGPVFRWRHKIVTGNRGINKSRYGFRAFILNDLFHLPGAGDMTTGIGETKSTTGAPGMNNVQIPGR